MWRARFHVRQDTSRSIVYVEGFDVVACTETLSLDSVVQNPHPFSTALRVRIRIRRQGNVYVSDRIPVAGALSPGIRAFESGSTSSD